MTNTFLVNAHFRDVLEMERIGCHVPWTRPELTRALAGPSTIGRVVTQGDTIQAYAVYDLRRRSVELLRFAVHPRYRSRGYGRWLVNMIACRDPDVWPLHANVRETDLGTQRFLKAIGFRAVSVARGHYSDSGEDAYRFHRMPALVPKLTGIVAAAGEVS